MKPKFSPYYLFIVIAVLCLAINFAVFYGVYMLYVSLGAFYASAIVAVCLAVILMAVLRCVKNAPLMEDIDSYAWHKES